LYDSAHGLELKWYSVAALYERRQSAENSQYVFGGHPPSPSFGGTSRPPLQARFLAAKRESNYFKQRSAL
jgi:hypothetical protein